MPGLIAEGLSVLAGRSKTVKSWLTLHVALAVAAGTGELGGPPVEAGPVLYLALEDTARRFQHRLSTLGADPGGRPACTSASAGRPCRRTGCPA